MILLYYYFACYITLSTVLQSCHANDPEVIQQFWKQLYSQLPDPSLPNRLSNGQQMGVKLSVAVESAEFGHAYDDYVCRATIRLVTSWPIMDTKISDNTLVRMAGGTVMLDADRVWRPRVMVSGARHMKLFSRRLELQSFGKSSPPHRSLMQKGDADYGSGGEVSAQGNPGRQPVYVMSEIFNVEVLCTSPSIKHYLGAIHCPVVFSQETFHRENSDYIWQDRTTCTLSVKASEKISYVTLSTRYSDKSSSEGPQSNLSINLCFNPTALVLRAALPALLFTFLSFILLWSLPCGPQIISITQGGLVLLCLATWTHFSVAIPTHFSLVDAWFILCLAFISMTFLFTLYEHRRLDRLAKTRQIQQQRRIYSALSATALCVPKMPPCGAAGGGGGGGSGGSTCGCGGCSCAGGFCGAGGGFLGIGNGQTSQMGSGGSPPPLGLMHQASPVVMPTKLDICNEAYFRSVSSELSKDSSAIMSLGTALRLRCAKNGGLGVFEPNDSNLGLIKSQYALGSTPSTHPAPSGSFLQPLGPIAPSYCTTVVAVALPILYILAIIIFWGFFGAQGTVPKDCLVGSVTCQALDRS
uniref:Secreted protein n=1 Tax=Mesocestoides corti TaxID=53468 RepID=A0A5K3FA02_MESCO